MRASRKPLVRNCAPNAEKNELKPWLNQSWVIPPEQDAAFVCQMEEVLQLYTRREDERYPMVCFDESCKQLLKDIEPQLPAQPGKPRRYDYQYERNGVCNLFMMFEPLTGQRHVDVTETRTQLDYAQQLK